MLTWDAPLAAQARCGQQCRALIVGLALTFGLALACLAQVALAQERRFDFDIPAQPLANALELYGEVTGRNALYNSNLTVGRRSRTVSGQLSSGDALAILLEGSGLTAGHVTHDSFVLLPAAAPVAAVQSYTVTQYFGRIQASLQKTLCADSEARPGGYRVAVRLWIDAAGDVNQYERIGSTGAPRADESIDRTLRRLRIGGPRPADMAQPVSIVIVPQTSGLTMGCDQLANGRIRAAAP
ncbi:TonB C-terminal domain-containing protein [Bradyrhizobium sp. LHD-71]|uniref:TonB C-terminal domain-containing protein n=1 Tax=Bradyrhizobium sp. LHD-71 TaxID=3072141 RepID=UPI00280C43D7|nr:TonB C-terminal domain-containing protein [Bradyrhizobium sp. LHD-71]MDQ8727794.1 TonB C-terminal domain-containing protein [Bradyrhizobium sp. LHD-71]